MHTINQPVVLSAQDVNQHLDDLFEHLALQGFKPDVILGVSPTGVELSSIIASMYKCELMLMVYGSEYGQHPNSGIKCRLPIITDSNILIVDALANSGHTLAELDAFYKNNQTKTYALVSRNYPDTILPELVSLYCNSDVTFPWE